MLDSSMRTLVLSDLHLGSSARPRLRESARALTALFRHLGAAPLRIILNGDTFDLVAESERLDSEVLAVMRGFVGDPSDVGVLACLGRVVDAGGELVVRPGEDDLELREPEVQSTIVSGLGASMGGQRRVSFAEAGEPTVFEVGGMRVVVTRPKRSATGEGRRLAAELLSPLRVHYGAGLAEHLRPDYEAAVLAAIAVNPTAVKLVFQRRAESSARLRSAAEVRASLFILLDVAALDQEERNALSAALDPELTLMPADYPYLDRARLKLFDHCLSRRPRTDAQGLRRVRAEEAREFGLEARRLGAAALLFAHSHVPAWSDGGAPQLVDTGSWCPTIDAPALDREGRARRVLDAWERIPRLEALAEPGLAARAGLRRRQTAVLVEPLDADQGARLRLFDWSCELGIVGVREAELRRS